MDTAIVQPMTKDEALTLTAQIREHAGKLRELLVQVYEREGWRVLGYASMNEYILREFPESKGHLYRQLWAGRTTENLEYPNGYSIPEGVLRPIATKEYIEQPEAQREIWQEAVAHTKDGKQPTYKDVTAARDRYEETRKHTRPKSRDYITMDEWNAMPESEQIFRLSIADNSLTMNQPNDNIEWAMWSWNPVTGCLHDCDYCYARDIANRFYPQKFVPSFVPDRLPAPKNTKMPSARWNGDIGYKGVFVCSMADLFGKWVPETWITSVLKVIRDNPQWEFLLLTKFPIRMADFEYPPNVWLGTTVDYQWRIERAEKAFRKIKASGFDGICWLSCEPMMERLSFGSLEMFDWIVMGGASKSTQTPEHRPPPRDIIHLTNQADVLELPVYWKKNLWPGISDEQRLREYPRR